MQCTNELNFAPAYARLYIPRMTIGNRLDKAMKAANIRSQSALKRASGVPQATISRILKGGGAKGPEADTVKKLAAACNVNFDWLNEGIGLPERHRSGHVESEPSVEIKNDTEASASEIVDLINAYRTASVKDRVEIMASAKLAAKRAVRRRAAANQG
jgi:transcriptional regulator with XRE-family HTH domain